MIPAARPTRPARASAAPAVVRGRRLGPSSGQLAPGSRVRTRDLSVRVFADGRHGFAIAFVEYASYPVASTNGGRTWRIDGPAFQLPVADAGLAVDQGGVANAHTFFAWEAPGYNSVIDVTPDGGRIWWQSFLPEQFSPLRPWTARSWLWSGAV